VTQDELARSYLTKATARLRVLDVLMEAGAWSDVVRESQELVELALKAVLRQVGIDPPKWHDVGPVLQANAGLLPEPVRTELAELARISKWLRKEREFSFYGDVDLVPTDAYSREDAERARTDARRVLETVRVAMAD
jgi:hypothetical protein